MFACMWRKRLKDRIRIPRTSRSVSFLNFALAIGSLIAVALTLADGRLVDLVRGVASQSTLEYQVATSLDRFNADILLLTMQPDGNVRWPDGGILTVEQSSLLMPSWFKRHSEPVLAVFAEPDTQMLLVRPLLAAAQEFGHSRAILVTREGAKRARL